MTTGGKVDALALKHLGRALTEGETRSFACEYLATTTEQVSIPATQYTLRFIVTKYTLRFNNNKLTKYT